MGLFSKKVDKKYSEGLKKTRTTFWDKLKIFFGSNKIDDSFYDELEKTLIEADLGAKLTIGLVSNLKDASKAKNLSKEEDVIDILANDLKSFYDFDEQASKINYNKDGLTVIMMMGVNGVGKTTSIAKLTKKILKENKKVLWVGADTFRAGAVTQLQIWADRLNVNLVSQENSDPSSVIYKGLAKAKEENYDVVIIDTAGRLQTKINLMNEVDKMVRVIEKVTPSCLKECFLVLDGTMGQNGLFQAQNFIEVAPISGVILTKMDGTSKGGIVFAIKDKYDLPVKYIGLGEGIDDLEEFDIDSFISSILNKED